jgi:DNA-binding transcriptional MerR regulator
VVSSARASSGASLLSIGQVLQRLAGEFPDLSPSKLRFLEDRDLVKPSRTPAGYRTYSSQDVERLRFILGLQRDHYLPLRVIKEYLDELDRGGQPSLPGVARVVQPAAVGRRDALTRNELLEAAGCSEQLLSDAISHGLIPAGALFAPDHQVVLETLNEAERFGVTPRHLRGIRLQVEREMELVSRAAGAMGSTQKSSQAEASRELSGIIMQLRHVLIRQALDTLES